MDILEVAFVAGACRDIASRWWSWVIIRNVWTATRQQTRSFPAQDVDVDNHASWFAPVRHLPNYILLRIRYRIAVSMLDMKATPWSTPDIIGELSPTLRGLREKFGSIPLQPATGKNSVTSQFTLPLRTFATSHLLGRLFILASFATPSHLDAILGTHFYPFQR